MDGPSALVSARGGVHEVVPLWGAVHVVQCEVKCVPKVQLARWKRSRFSL